MGIVSRKIQLRVLLAVSAVVITYAVGTLYPERFDTWNSRIIDHLFAIRSRIKSEPIVPGRKIIHVDANLNAFRSQHAQVIRNLHAMGISVVAFDTVFHERVGDEEDLPLIRAVNDSGNVFLGIRLDTTSPPSLYPNGELNPDKKEYLRLSKWHLSVEGNPDRLLEARHPMMMTYPALASASQGLGFVDIFPDPDGIVRRIPLLVRYEGAFYPSISFQTVCRILGVTPPQIVLRPGRSILLKDAGKRTNGAARDLVIPIDAAGNLILNFTGFHEQIPHYSYSEILQANETVEKLAELKKALHEKIVVLSEAVATPYEGRPISAHNHFSSGTIHAIVVNTILQGSFLRVLSMAEMLFIQFLLLGLFIVGSIRYSAVTLTLGTLLLSLIVVTAGVTLFIHFNVIMQFVHPLLILFGALLFVLSANAIERAILLAETERARKLAERELEIGREIQAGFFPTNLPAPPGWELVTHFQAARHVSGDFYDAFSIGKKGDLGFVVADVCDKGVGAALFMALFRSLIRVLSGSEGDGNPLASRVSHHDPAQTLKHTIHSVNNYISTTHEADSMFSTIFFGILQPATGVLHYINGGHEPPLIIAARKFKAFLSPTGPAVGVYPNAEFTVGNIQLEPEDTLLAYTDGVVDAQNKTGQTFSRDRLAKLAAKTHSSAKALVDDLINQINHHNSGQDQFDDITILALQRKAPLS